MKELFRKRSKVGRNPWIVLAVLILTQVFSRCGGRCTEEYSVCRQSELTALFDAAFEEGDYWIFENRDGTIRDSIYVISSQAFSGCFSDVVKCNEIRGGLYLKQLSGTINGNDIISPSDLTADLIVDSNKGFDRVSLVLNTVLDIPGFFMLNYYSDNRFKQVRTAHSVDSKMTPIDTTINGFVLSKAMVLEGAFPIIDANIGFVQIIYQQDTLNLVETSNAVP